MCSCSVSCSLFPLSTNSQFYFPGGLCHSLSISLSSSTPLFLLHQLSPRTLSLFCSIHLLLFLKLPFVFFHIVLPLTLCYFPRSLLICLLCSVLASSSFLAHFIHLSHFIHSHSFQMCEPLSPSPPSPSYIFSFFLPQTGCKCRARLGAGHAVVLRVPGGPG